MKGTTNNRAALLSFSHAYITRAVEGSLLDYYGNVSLRADLTFIFCRWLAAFVYPKRSNLFLTRYFHIQVPWSRLEIGGYLGNLVFLSLVVEAPVLGGLISVQELFKQKSFGSVVLIRGPAHKQNDLVKQ